MRGRVEGALWERGVSNYWGQVLFNRALKVESFREALDAAVQDLMTNYVGQERLEEVVQAYAAGRCDAFTTDASGLYATRLKAASPEEHIVLP